MQKPHRNSKGFTLIEVLVSMLILAGTSIVLYQSWSGSLNAVRKGRLYNTISLLMQKKVVDFEVDAKGKKIDELSDKSGDFGDDFPDFSWEIKLQPFKVPPIVPPELKGEGENGNGGSSQNQLAETIIKTMSDYFEKAVREVNVTVIYKLGEHSFKYSVNTIYVDYTVDLPSGI